MFSINTLIYTHSVHPIFEAHRSEHKVFFPSTKRFVNGRVCGMMDDVHGFMGLKMNLRKSFKFYGVTLRGTHLNLSYLNFRCTLMVIVMRFWLMWTENNL